MTDSLQVISTVNTMTCCDYSSTVDSHPRQITYSWEITSIVENSRSRPSACCSRTRLNTPKTSSSSEVTTNAPVSTGFTVSTTSVRVFLFQGVTARADDGQASDDITSSCGRHSRTASTVYPLLPLSTKRSLRCTVVW